MVGPLMDDYNSSMFMAHNAVCYWPMFGLSIIRHVEHPLMLRAVEGPLMLRPIEGPLFLWPFEGTLFYSPYEAHGNYSKYVAHGYCGLVLKNRLLRPLANRGKKNSTDYKQTNKQDNKEINKKATYARLSRLLHILHPLGVKVHHQCKYREQSSISYTVVVKVGDQCK